jgi:DNA-directed RNA polymerase specialized sigma24 family protein
MNWPRLRKKGNKFQLSLSREHCLALMQLTAKATESDGDEVYDIYLELDLNRKVLRGARDLADSARERRTRAVRLRRRGYTYRQIGASFGVGVERARQMVSRGEMDLRAAANRELAALYELEGVVKLADYIPGNSSHLE